MTDTVAVNFNNSMNTRTPVILAKSTVNSGLKDMFGVRRGALVLLIKYNTTNTITNVFGTPVTNLIFALRILVVSLAVTSLLPLLISYIATTAISCVLANPSTVFGFRVSRPFLVRHVPSTVLLNVTYKLISLCFAQTVGSIRGVFHQCDGPCVGLTVNNTVLDVLVFLFPPLCNRKCSAVGLLLGNMAGRS